MIRLKAGVKLKDLQPQMLVALHVVEEAFKDVNSDDYDCIITSGNDSVHGENSLHYKGLALDFRTKHVPFSQFRLVVVNRVKEALGDEFDVLFEDIGGANEHLHVEYDPD